MGELRTLVLSAVVAIVLAVIGVTAVLAAVNPSATEVAGNMSGTDPNVPPDFYGTR